MKHFVVAALCSACLMPACSTSTRESAREEVQSKGGYVRIPDDSRSNHVVPVGRCRIRGTIVTVGQIVANGQDDICSKSPCSAAVRVDSVLGYGSGFGTVLAIGGEVKAFFQYSLGPTETLLPTMQPALPGLSAGDHFVADIQFLEESGPGIVVDNYEKQ